MKELYIACIEQNGSTYAAWASPKPGEVFLLRASKSTASIAEHRNHNRAHVFTTHLAFLLT
jgi:hypothetical protein